MANRAIALRDFQATAIDEVRAAIRAGSRSILLVAPTGSGKTVIASHMIHGAQQRGKRILFLAHRKELIDQCSNKLDDLGIDHGVIMSDHWRRKPHLRVHVASVPTLVNRELAEPPDLIFIDEAHRSRAESYVTILERFPNAVCVGLTATPIRADGRGLGKLFKSMVQCPDVQALTDMRFLVPTRVYAPSRPVDVSGIKKSVGDYNIKQLGERMNRRVLVGDIVDHWRRLGENRLTVCFAVLVAHSKAIVEQFQDAGVAAAHLDGTTPKHEREAVLADLAAGRIRVLVNVGVLTEGWDCPAVSCIILARPTCSMGLYLQMAGRTLRPYPGKADALILDHAGCTLEHGFVDQPREWWLSEDRKMDASKIDTSDTIRVCPECGYVMPKTQMVCRCGYEFSGASELPTHVAGDLQDITDAKQQRYSKMNDQQRRAMWTLARNQAHDRGWKPTYASVKYKAMFGAWPPRAWEREWEAEQKEVFV